jgi:hypothetical protein
MVSAAVEKASAAGLIQKVVFKSNVTPAIDLTKATSAEVSLAGLAGLGQDLERAGAFVRWAQPAVYVTTPAGVVTYAPYGEPGNYFYPVVLGTVLVGGVVAYYLVKGIMCLRKDRKRLKSS